MHCQRGLDGIDRYAGIIRVPCAVGKENHIALAARHGFQGAAQVASGSKGPYRLPGTIMKRAVACIGTVVIVLLEIVVSLLERLSGRGAVVRINGGKRVEKGIKTRVVTADKYFADICRGGIVAS